MSFVATAFVVFTASLWNGPMVQHWIDPTEGVWKTTRKMATHNRFYPTVQDRDLRPVPADDPALTGAHSYACLSPGAQIARSRCRIRGF